MEVLNSLHEKKLFKCRCCYPRLFTYGQNIITKTIMITVAIVVAMLGSGSVDVAFIPAMDMTVIPLSEEDTICHIGTSRKECLRFSHF